ncbi:hypothetical protein [Fictibacillus sp. KU28468]|nr:hypothetical protein [Fictibacillus sp. KU28468]UZJ76868.1 hypothetical protein OKX00_11625 [Fictibacillus sp. KU28468]
MENWTPAHLFLNILPELKERGVTIMQFEKMFNENAKGLFSGVTENVISL